MDNIIFVDYLCCPETKLHVTCKVQGFEKIAYNDVSGIFIPEILMGIVFEDNNQTICCYMTR